MSQRIGMIIKKHPEHVLRGHPESPERFGQFEALPDWPIADSLEEVSANEVDESTLARAHTTDYINHVKAAVGRAPTRLDGGDTYLTAGSWQAALGSVSSAIAAADYGLESGRIGFSLCRPPGHHATGSQAMGFCLFNNVAIAARHLQANKGIERILIVDFDVHHGNGTQAIFEQDPSVFYFSTHQRGIFPGTGALSETGLDQGEGTVLNVPLPAYTGERKYLELFEPVLESICQRFQPGCLLVSAGYDAHWKDPLANLLFTCRTYYTLASLLQRASQQHCAGRLSFFLEGGYHPRALFHSIIHTLHGLAGVDPPEDPIGQPNHPEAELTHLMEQLLHP